MNIVDKREKHKGTKLGDLRKGDTFMIVDTPDEILKDIIKTPLEQSIFMVIKNPFCEVPNLVVSVVCLNDGTSFRHTGEEEVIPVETELTIVSEVVT